MIRVNHDEIDIIYSEGGSPTYVLNGKPFTGIGYEEWTKDQLASEITYLNGIQDGIAKEWYENGQLKSIDGLKWNRLHGKFQDWYENGQMKREGIIEFGIVLEKKEWDPDGHLIKEYHIQPDSDRYKKLLAERTLFKQMGYIDTNKEESSLKIDERIT